MTNKEFFGWSRETDFPSDFPPPDYFARDFASNANHFPPVQKETFFDYYSLSWKSYIESVYGAWRDLAKKYGVTPIILFNPAPESSGKYAFFKFKEIEEEIASFQAKNPEVIIPEQIEFWPDSKFSVFSHVSTIFCEENAERVGRILKKIIAKDGATPAPRRADFVWGDAKEYRDIDFRQPFCAFGWGPRESNQNQQHWRFIGPQDHAYLYTVVKPRQDYRIRVYFHTVAAEAALQRLKVRVNDGELSRVGMHWQDPYIMDFFCPETLVSHYLGWLKMELDIRQNPRNDRSDGASPGQAETPGGKIAISKVVFEPAQ